MRTISLQTVLSFYQDHKDERVMLQPLRQLQKHEDCVFSADDGNEHVIVHDVTNDTYIALVMSIECGMGDVSRYRDFAVESGRGDVILAERFATRAEAFKEVLAIIATDNENI